MQKVADAFFEQIKSDHKRSGRYAGLRLGATASNVKDAKISCAICDNVFFVARHRNGVAKYCSRACYYKSLTNIGSIELICDICGNAYRRSPSRAKSIIKTCSLKCRGLATRTEKPISKDYPSVRRWLKRRGWFARCERCGFDDVTEILVAHHKNRDRTNNYLSNLECLCPNCHAIEHMAENKNGWVHFSTKRKLRRVKGKDTQCL